LLCHLFCSVVLQSYVPRTGDSSTVFRGRVCHSRRPKGAFGEVLRFPPLRMPIGGRLDIPTTCAVTSGHRREGSHAARIRQTCLFAVVALVGGRAHGTILAQPVIRALAPGKSTPRNRDTPLARHRRASPPSMRRQARASEHCRFGGCGRHSEHWTYASNYDGKDSPHHGQLPIRRFDCTHPCRRQIRQSRLQEWRDSHSQSDLRGVRTMGSRGQSRQQGRTQGTAVNSGGRLRQAVGNADRRFALKLVARLTYFGISREAPSRQEFRQTCLSRWSHLGWWSVSAGTTFAQPGKFDLGT